MLCNKLINKTNLCISHVDMSVLCIRYSGDYLNMSASDLPLLWLAYLSDPSDSGKIHSDVSIRWKNSK